MTKANISWITDNLATGGDMSYNDTLAMEQFEELIHMDIDLIIDTREEAEDSDLWSTTAVSYLHIPTNDAVGHTIPTEHFDRAVEAALPVLEGGGKVFVHCHMGVNRGPSTAFAIMLAQGMNAEKAFDLIREKRPQAGIYYAMDALWAHLVRKSLWSTKEGRRREDRLRAHYNKVMTKEIRKSIQHVIRSGHAKDRAERLVSS